MHATTAPQVRGPGANPLPPAIIIRIGRRQPRRGKGGGRQAARGEGGEPPRADATTTATRPTARSADEGAGRKRAPAALEENNEVRPCVQLMATDNAPTSAPAR